MPEPQPLDYATLMMRDRPLRRWAMLALRWALFVFLVLLNAGWLVPMYLAVTSLWMWCWLDAIGNWKRNGFPHLFFAQQAFAVAFVWLSAVVLTWTVLHLRRFWPIRAPR